MWRSSKPIGLRRRCCLSRHLHRHRHPPPVLLREGVWRTRALKRYRIWLQVRHLTAPTNGISCLFQEVCLAPSLYLFGSSCPILPYPPPPLPSSISHPPRIAHAGNPRAGELTATGCTASVKGSWALPGNGTEFDLRIGPDYKKFGKKAPSAENIYELVGADAFKRSKGQAFTHPALSLPTLLHLLLSQQGRGRFTRWCGWGALMLM